MANHITPHEARTIAAAAFCDPRSVVKAIEGKPLAPLTLARIKNALDQIGRADLLPSNPNTPQAALDGPQKGEAPAAASRLAKVERKQRKANQPMSTLPRFGRLARPYLDRRPRRACRRDHHQEGRLMKRTALYWPPRLVTQERPAPGAVALLESVLPSLPAALADRDLSTVGLVVVSPSSALALVGAAWNRQTQAEITTRQRTLDIARKGGATGGTTLTETQIPVVLGTARRLQLVALDFAPEPARKVSRP